MRLALLLTAAISAVTPWAAPDGPDATKGKRVVIVDAGHGGPDNGMHGPIGGKFRILEKDITLAVSKRLARTLEERGMDVVMTRKIGRAHV